MVAALERKLRRHEHAERGEGVVLRIRNQTV
jgi:hypothetical protein